MTTRQALTHNQGLAIERQEDSCHISLHKIGGQAQVWNPICWGWCQCVQVRLGGAYFGKTHQVSKCKKCRQGPARVLRILPFGRASVDF